MSRFSCLFVFSLLMLPAQYLGKLDFSPACLLLSGPRHDPSLAFNYGNRSVTALTIIY